MRVSSEHKIIIIINNILPYKQELVNLLALPSGSEIRLRYQRKYLPTITEFSSLVHKAGTVVLRNRGTAELLPMRTCQINHVEMVGDILHLVVEVNNISALADEPKNKERQLKAFEGLMAEAIGGYPNLADDDLENVVFYEDGRVFSLLKQWEIESSKNELQHWGTCVRHMALHFSFKELPFIRVIALQDNKGRSLDFTRFPADGGGYKISRGKPYSLLILQRTYSDKKGDSLTSAERYIELRCNNDNLKMPWNKQAILGKVDLVEFHLRTNKDVDAGTIQVFLVVTDPNQLVPPPLKISIVVSPSPLTFISGLLRALLFFAFLSAFVASDPLSHVLESWRGTPLSVSVEKLAIIGMLITGVPTGQLAKNILGALKLNVK